MLIGDLSLVFICGRIPSNHNHLRYLCAILSGESGRSELSEFYLADPVDPVICVLSVSCPQASAAQLSSLPQKRQDVASTISASLRHSCDRGPRQTACGLVGWEGRNPYYNASSVVENPCKSVSSVSSVFYSVACPQASAAQH